MARKKSYQDRKKLLCNDCMNHCKEILMLFEKGVFVNIDENRECRNTFCIKGEDGKMYGGIMRCVFYDRNDDCIRVMWEEEVTKRISFSKDRIWDYDNTPILLLYSLLKDRYFTYPGNNVNIDVAFDRIDKEFPESDFYFYSYLNLLDEAEEDVRKLVKRLGQGILLPPYSEYYGGQKYLHAIYDMSFPCKIFAIRQNAELKCPEVLLYDKNEEIKLRWSTYAEWTERDLAFTVHDMIKGGKYAVLPQEIIDAGDDIKYEDLISIIKRTFAAQ